jgi:hypothetical protein
VTRERRAAEAIANDDLIGAGVRGKKQARDRNEQERAQDCEASESKRHGAQTSSKTIARCRAGAASPKLVVAARDRRASFATRRAAVRIARAD